MATGKKDFSGIAIPGTAGRTVFDAIEQGTHTMGQQTTASPQEKAERMSAMKTQGRKGCKAIRINMAFSPENHKFIKVLSKATGRTMTELCNDVIAAYREEHPEIMGEAQKVIETISSGRFSAKKED